MLKFPRFATIAAARRALPPIAALALTSCCAATASAQQVAPRVPNGTPNGAPTGQIVTPGSLAGAIQDSERTQNADSLLGSYGQAVTTPELARVAIGQLLNDYYQLRNQAQTADQATQAVSEAMLRFMVLQTAQNQILVQQNQQLLQQQARMIELMEEQAKRAAPPARR